jgi:hypothetical protein
LTVKRATDVFFGVPVATILVLLVALVGAIDLVSDGNLSGDFTNYAAIVGGSSGLLAIGRGLDTHSKP